jgi:hypothetical protein
MSIFANPANEAPDGYVRALLDLIGDRDPLSVLPGTPATLAERVRALDDARLRTPEGEGKWSVLHVVQHLADSELMVSVRYRMILSHDTPPLAGYDQDLYAKHLHYENADLEGALDSFGALRRANVRLLASLTAEERKRGGIHSERGFEDVTRLMTLHAAHDLVHLKQIARILGEEHG